MEVHMQEVEEDLLVMALVQQVVLVKLEEVLEEDFTEIQEVLHLQIAVQEAAGALMEEETVEMVVQELL
jgi:hypothetical protein